LRVRKVGKKSLKNLRKNIAKSDKAHPDPDCALNFPHTAPLPNTPTASSVKANANKRFYI
jgi:hypothetical protein